jgi:phosphoserine phosphatase
MTVDGYREYVREFCKRPVVGFDNMTFKEAFYKPMIEVVNYLNENGFTVYICSGTDRIFCRELTDGVLPITENHVIGMDVMLKARGQGSTDGLDYVYKQDDKVVRTDELLIKNVKMNKVSLLARELGKKPVLSFGNSTGDTSMAVYVTSDNPYRSEAFMLVADDDVRDYGNPEKAEELRKKWEDYGWTVISMKNDFSTIYGEDVKRTSK